MHLSDPHEPVPSAEPLVCSGCAGGTLRRDTVTTALWQGERLVLVENIPALVCQRCGERYFEDETAMALDMMRGASGPAAAPVRTVSVPVYAYAAPGPGARKGKTP